MEHTARLLVPHLLLMALLILNMASLPLPYADAVKNHLVLMAVYYWAIYRPTLVPPFYCFLIGLAMDVVGGFPLGLNACVLVILQWLVRDQRKFLMGQPFIVIWAAFGLVALSASLMQWGLIGIRGWEWTQPLPLMAGTMISLFLFPFVTMLLVAAHRLLPVPPRTLGN
jgi:rod shape-determining protein MreD